MTIDTIVGLLAPHRCIGCDGSVAVLCRDCIDLFIEDVPARCAGCKRLSGDYKVCHSCKSWLKLHTVLVVTYYDGIGEQLVHKMKFDAKRDACVPIATEMSKLIKKTETDYDYICPVPTAPKRVRERGFDHAVVISKYVSARTKIPYRNVLMRVTNSRQVGATRTERLKQMERAFEVCSDAVAGKRILLVDDVFTTGATLVAASQMLRDAGARTVSAVVFCQK